MHAYKVYYEMTVYGEIEIFSDKKLDVNNPEDNKELNKIFNQKVSYQELYDNTKDYIENDVKNINFKKI